MLPCVFNNTIHTVNFCRLKIFLRNPKPGAQGIDRGSDDKRVALTTVGQLPNLEGLLWAVEESTNDGKVYIIRDYGYSFLEFINYWYVLHKILNQRNLQS